MKKIIFVLGFILFLVAVNAQSNFAGLVNNYIKGYEKLGIAPTELDYKTNFKNIKSIKEVLQQQTFFIDFEKQLAKVNVKKLSAQEKFRYKQLQYEVSHNIQRTALEKKWNEEGRNIPADGLNSLPDYKDWYAYYIKHFTSVNITPEEVFELGQNEVKKVQQELKNLQTKLGFSNEESFYNYLQNDTFYLKDKQQVLDAYAQIDKNVRKGIFVLYPSENIPEVAVMEWPGATAQTPPGIYQDIDNNSYGKDVFQFNFYGQKHNRRCMEWLYMHEAIPGHHLQSVMKKQQKDATGLSNYFFYFGNAEGWACYVEDYGKEIGMYTNDYEYVGKWQWDLVRSARLIMEVGIHYYGWSKDKALQYWKENIKGQDEIAMREITRITNWAGQALCYKVGAYTIKKIVTQKMKRGLSHREANIYLLAHSDLPLQVLLDDTLTG